MGLVAHNSQELHGIQLLQNTMTLSRSQGTPKVKQVLLGCSALFALDSEGHSAQLTQGIKDRAKNKECSTARE